MARRWKLCLRKIALMASTREHIPQMITSEAMLDPAVSLGMLRLDTQLALAGFWRYPARTSTESSPKIQRAKALVEFSRYGAALGAASDKLNLNRRKQGVGLRPRFVSDAG
jgi:hypothetical protein